MAGPRVITLSSSAFGGMGWEVEQLVKSMDKPKITESKSNVRVFIFVGFIY